MAQLIGHVLSSNGDTSLINGPSTDVGADGLGQMNALGERAFDNAGAEYVYLKGVASLAAGDWVMFGALNASPYTAVRMLNDANSGGAGLLAVAIAAVLANSFGWFAIYGNIAVANVATTATTNGALYRSGTTARASVSTTAKDAIFGAILVAASVSNVGPVFLNYPFNMDQSTL